MSVAFLSLGSNKGDRLSVIQQAVNFLSADNSIEIAAASSFYETEPWGKKNQNWFVNAVIAVRTELSPVELLRVCQDIEARLGRKRESEEHWGERPIDIDILFYDNLIFSNEILTIPHKFVHKRAFALVPMLEIKANYVHPVLNKTISELHEELEDPEDVFLYGTITGSRQE
ncbi:TPA: 2-amino-4-hydroxy-6-hydroxymethyldihydropteridine diphosphokinase [Candidatus Galligastranaerophilus gallistercoris]|nr:2-amino-4-hydroxy-6-hydroxymethyldihydropteridine diphosphokinase [Candidatus Galligastranaerophilus gallistercoris]